MNKIITPIVVAFNAVNAAVLKDATLPQVQQSSSPEAALALKRAKAEAYMEMMDTNRDGKIDAAEIIANSAAINKERTDQVKMANAQNFIRMLDQNGDNEIDFDELVNREELDEKANLMKVLRSVFAQNDIDGDGYISLAEMVALELKMHVNKTSEEIA